MEFAPATRRRAIAHPVRSSPVAPNAVHTMIPANAKVRHVFVVQCRCSISSKTCGMIVPKTGSFNCMHLVAFCGLWFPGIAFGVV